MEIADAIKKAIQELILPELDIMKADNREIKVSLQLTYKRLDDISAHLIDQSRRIDELNQRIDDTNKRIDDVNKRMDDLRVELRDEISKTNARIDFLRAELRDEIAKTNLRLDRLYEVIVRREEHEKLESRVLKIEQELAAIKAKPAA